jgi:hypothetical protein
MTRKPDAFEAAVKGKQLQTRSKGDIQADLDEAIRWAETEGRALPIRVKRGRPKANEPAVETRSVTVRFPVTVARQVEAAAKRSGETLSEFVRAAAYAASRSVSRAPAKPRSVVVRGK